MFTTYILVSPDNYMSPEIAFVSMSVINILNYATSYLPIFLGFAAQVGAPIYQWLSARLQYFQCVSTGDTAVLHKAIGVVYVVSQVRWISIRAYTCHVWSEFSEGIHIFPSAFFGMIMVSVVRSSVCPAALTLQATMFCGAGSFWYTQRPHLETTMIYIPLLCRLTSRWSASLACCNRRSWM